MHSLPFQLSEHFTYPTFPRSQGVRISEGPLYHYILQLVLNIKLISHNSQSRLWQLYLCMYLRTYMYQYSFTSPLPEFEPLPAPQFVPVSLPFALILCPYPLPLSCALTLCPYPVPLPFALTLCPHPVPPLFVCTCPCTLSPLNFSVGSLFLQVCHPHVMLLLDFLSMRVRNIKKPRGKSPRL